MAKSNKATMNFEKTLSRLETISEAMNSVDTGLDKSLSLYEEADALIGGCLQHLKAAEDKIEVLTKKRDGGVVLDDDGSPKTSEF
ncbi:MAG: exodeoxyribonuclease VII small subunit [Waddliaceae bacterium]|jgi:exodeoxyribonuclease VII small subunit|nr:exodeoxyribonuclease VII small subunit [Waddliaceae bacterium]MBT3578608.1 exodeoxyribonuclease VII small subunit [Waddliaceae bacterium]MBT4445534.1 exodeoxyribonuclease VII small subunit [Waddliaceae bacterium]MBT6928405.1 exodeoxyribonuclease VII small subunit [Waddliaceae bacterium]MBT7265091.1 exodeoxyribonuclease VII small subunit [Waddliaceae bacterium]